MQASNLGVSTQEQGRSGLGLAAQRQEIETFGAREGFLVKSCRPPLVQRGKLRGRPRSARQATAGRSRPPPTIVSRHAGKRFSIGA
jgi:hypothetical protein